MDFIVMKKWGEQNLFYFEAMCIICMLNKLFEISSQFGYLLLMPNLSALEISAAGQRTDALRMTYRMRFPFVSARE